MSGDPNKTSQSADPVAGAVKVLAGRVVSVEAGLVLLGVVVWIAVITNLSRVTPPVAFALLGAAFLLTCIILWIMRSRTKLLSPAGPGGAELERQVNEHIREPISSQEYSRTLRKPRQRNSGRGG